MRTLIIIAVGLVIGLLALRLTPASRRGLAAGLFSGGWLLACAYNLRIGLSHGYSLQEELPIHALLYGVPVIAAVIYAWRSRHHD